MKNAFNFQKSPRYLLIVLPNRDPICPTYEGDVPKVSLVSAKKNPQAKSLRTGKSGRATLKMILFALLITVLMLALVEVFDGNLRSIQDHAQLICASVNATAIIRNCLWEENCTTSLSTYVCLMPDGSYVSLDKVETKSEVRKNAEGNDPQR